MAATMLLGGLCLVTVMILSRWLPTVWQQRLENVKKTLFEKGMKQMKNIFLVILAAVAMWIASMFTDGKHEMSLDYVPRDGYSDYDDMEEMFHDWRKHRGGENILEYRSRGGSGGGSNFRSGGGDGTTLEYRGRSARTGRYVHRER